MRSPCSGRSTATRCAWSTWVTTPGAVRWHPRARIGQLGVVKLVSDSSVGSGVHRVEALVGMDAMRHISMEHMLVTQLAEQFKVPVSDLPERIENVVTRLRNAEKELKQLRVQQVLSSAGELADKGTDVNGVTLVAEQVADGVDGSALRALASEVRNRLGSRPAVALFSPTTPRSTSWSGSTKPVRQGPGGRQAGAVVRRRARGPWRRQARHGRAAAPTRRCQGGDRRAAQGTERGGQRVTGDRELPGPGPGRRLGIDVGAVRSGSP